MAGAGDPAAVLVTGSTGFLGKRLTQRLREAGRRVVTPTRADGFDLMRDLLNLDGVSHVFHLAARTFVPAAWENPADFHWVNAHGTVRVLQQCRAADCAMTYCSAYVYGPPISLPIAETAPVRPNNPYAFSKFMGEEACRFYAQTFGLRVAILRPFNIYGPGQGAEFLIPHIVTQVVDPACAEVTMKDLAPRRDFIHVDDVVEAFLATERAPTGQTYNVGSGASVSVADVIRLAFEAFGAAKPVRSAEEVRANELDDVVADTAALRALGWRAKVTLADGVRELVEEARARIRPDQTGARVALN